MACVEADVGGAGIVAVAVAEDDDVNCSESVDMRSGSLSKPSSSERVGLRIGLEVESSLVSILI